MARRVLESLSGVGEVFAGDVLLRQTHYEISVWTDEDGVGPDGDPPVKVDGRIELTGIGEAVVLAGPRELTLRLQDGRRVPFFLTGTGGAIVGRRAPSST